MSSGGGTTVQQSTPWVGAQPYLTDVMRQAQNTFQSRPGSIPALTPETFTGASMVGQNINNPAVQNLENTSLNRAADLSAGGATNPFLDKTFQQAANQVRDYTDAQFTAGGRGGSASNQYILGQNLNNLATDIYGGAYNNDQNRSLAATQMMPSLLASSFLPSQEMMGVGNLFDQWNMQNFNLPWQNLQGYSTAVQGIPNFATTSTTQPSQSILPGLLGSAIMTAPFW